MDNKFIDTLKERIDNVKTTAMIMPINDYNEGVRMGISMIENIVDEWIQWLCKDDFLDELKEHDMEIYNKAIDDFVDRIYAILPNDIETRISSGAIALELSNIAEQLKEMKNV